jgi:nucleotide-binding universal stress UspA family protein
MTTILRPTRGGEASYANQDRAVALAKERDADLLLLYVSNVHFLDRVAGPVIVDIETELDEMGEFLLALVQERAEKAGVRARTLVLRGQFREALKQVVQEHEEVTTVVLGSAAGGTGVTTPAYLEDLVQWCHTEVGIEVIVIDGGEIIEHHKPEKADGG